MRAQREKRTGKKPRGRPPEPPSGKVNDKEQINLTDEHSRIMPVSGGGFEQCYNAQAANDKRQLVPMFEKLKALPEALGQACHLLAGNGYFSEANVEACAAADIEPLIALGREAQAAGACQRKGALFGLYSEKRASITWAKRLKRVFNLDVETCSECGGDVRIIASIEDPAVIQKILAHLDNTASSAATSLLPDCRASPSLPVGLFD